MHKLEINMEKILPIIKKSLYSDRDIFLRELVSNSCDAISKLKILQDRKESPLDETPFAIHIQINKDQGTITISDNGIGMTEDEVKRYIAQLAFSGAEEFAKKYETGKDSMIGHFGLGFYSAFMVSAKVELDSLSHLPGAQPVLWNSDGSHEYTLDQGTRKERGTSITLYIDSSSQDLLDESAIQSILNKYCAYLPYPIYLNGKHVNEKEPLWIKNPSDLQDQDYIDFYHDLYPGEPDPIFWVHLTVDAPFQLRGILYFPKWTGRVDLSKSHVKLFCNRVFVSDQCREIFPEHLAILKGAIDSQDIPLNVSRSQLQLDRTVRQIASHISKKVADRLVFFFNNDRPAFEKAWPNMEVIVKLGALHEEKFYDRISPIFIWKSVSGAFLTLEEYQAKTAPSSAEKVFYLQGDKLTDSDALISLYQKSQIEVILSSCPLDNPLFGMIESKKSPLAFCRIDGKLDEALIDSTKTKTLLNEDGKTEGSVICSIASKYLEDKELTVEPQSLASDQIHAMVVIDEKERRLREYFALHNHEMALPPSKKTLILNTNSKIVTHLPSLETKDPQLARLMTQQLYDLALLSQKELDHEGLTRFISRSSLLLEALSAASH